MTTTLEYERTGRQCEALRIVFRSVHMESGLMLFSLIGWEFPDHPAVNLHLMSASIRLWSHLFRFWMVDFDSSH